MHILIVYRVCVWQINVNSSFLNMQYMFQKLTHTDNRYFLLFFLGMIDEFKRQDSEK